MKLAKIEFTIAENGEVCFRTGDLSGTHHASADEFLREVEETLGGETLERKKLPRPVEHDHEHAHAHKRVTNRA